jgi:integrase
MLTVRPRGKIYHVDLSNGHEHLVRGTLGTSHEDFAKRLGRRLEIALLEGPQSSEWAKLSPLIPPGTFARFAEFAGLKQKPQATWQELRATFDKEISQQIRMGDLKESSAQCYKRAAEYFERFMEDKKKSTLVQDITEDVAREFRENRIKQMAALKRSGGGSSYASIGNTLRRIFAPAVEKGLIPQNPFPYEREPKPKKSARPFTADELVRLEKYAGEDSLLFMLFRWTGFRRSDVVDARWGEVHFDTKEIQRVTIKRGKEVFVPITRELLSVLRKEYKHRMPKPTDQIVLNSKTAMAFGYWAVGTRLHHLGKRAGVRNVHPHRFRSTYAVDLLLRGVPLPSVARILGDTVDMIVEHYLPYVDELKEHARLTLGRNKGIEQFATQQRHSRKRLSRSASRLRAA